MNSRYALVSKLNTSLYGEIYVATDKCTGNDVVVKLSSIPKRDCLENPQTEIDILEKLRDIKHQDGHQYIIKLVEAFPVTVDGDDLLCMVMEYAPGGDMLDKIVECEERKKKLSFSRIRKYAMMMAKGVAFLHSQGIVHMDLSLENMLLTLKDEIRICDFGQAQAQKKFRAFSPRRGKIAYMAPEVFKYHVHDGCKADVWSLGVIFWSMLANGSLYDKPVPSDPHFAYVAEGKPGLQKLFEGSDVMDIPSQCLDLLSKMLAIEPSNRYTMEQVLQHPWLQENKNKKKKKTNLIRGSNRRRELDIVPSCESRSSTPVPILTSSENNLPVSGENMASSPTRRLIVRLNSENSSLISPSPLQSPLQSPSTSVFSSRMSFSSASPTPIENTPLDSNTTSNTTTPSNSTPPSPASLPRGFLRISLEDSLDVRNLHLGNDL